MSVVEHFRRLSLPPDFARLIVQSRTGYHGTARSYASKTYRTLPTKYSTSADSQSAYDEVVCAAIHQRYKSDLSVLSGTSATETAFWFDPHNQEVVLNNRKSRGVT